MAEILLPGSHGTSFEDPPYRQDADYEGALMGGYGAGTFPYKNARIEPLETEDPLQPHIGKSHSSVVPRGDIDSVRAAIAASRDNSTQD